MKDTGSLAPMFKALGDPTRLRIFEYLRSCRFPVAIDDYGAIRPMTGPTAGEVCCHITGSERITSTVSFHLKELRIAGLITMERRGKNMICAVNDEAMRCLADYFVEGEIEGEERIGTDPGKGNGDG